jgi:uncharacterized membrane protein (UPF0127 family)
VTQGPGPWLVREAASGRVVADRVSSADSFLARFRGLMGRAALPPGHGLYLADSSIHMFFMRFAIDAVFVADPDASGRRLVVAVRPGLRPWTGIVMPVRRARGVIELASGTLARTGVQEGSTLLFEPAVAAEPGTIPAE